MERDLRAGFDYSGFPPMAKFSDRIWIGRGLDAQDTESLKAVGVTAIANLTKEDFKCDPGFQVLMLNQNDDQAISVKTLDRFLEWMAEREANQDIVLVHCHAAISRTPSFLIAWLIYSHGVPANAGADWLRREWDMWEYRIAKVRPIIHPAKQLKDSIIGYFLEKVA